jgi:glucose-1-phosphate cytidylyltransferase
MRVVILCGGRGTRLREETEFRPKPMVPIGSQPILWHIMKYYAHFGHSEFILCLGYKGEMIKDYFRNYYWESCDATLSLGRRPKVRFHERHTEEDWIVTLVDTGLDSMTGHRIKRVQRYIPVGGTFLLTYGDGLSTIDINASIRAHQQAKKVITLSAVHPAGRFGDLKIDENGKVETFKEKAVAEKTYINGGYMVCNYRLFEYLPEQESVVFEREPIARLVEEGQMNSFKHEGFWHPMDTYKDMEYLNSLWNERRAPWAVWKPAP